MEGVFVYLTCTFDVIYKWSMSFTYHDVLFLVELQICIVCFIFSFSHGCKLSVIFSS
jgi:hypothetical protein